MSVRKSGDGLSSHMYGTQTWCEEEKLPKKKGAKKAEPAKHGTPKDKVKGKDEAKDEEKPASPLPVPTHRRRTKSYRALAG